MKDLRMGVLKNELTSAIQSLSSRAEFGLVAFSDNNVAFSTQPVKASSGNKSSGITWVVSLSPSGMTCMEPGAIQTLQIANASRKRQKSCIIVSDGEPNCPDCSATNASIQASNWQHLPVNTLYIGGGGSQCMQNIANSNGGEYRAVAG